MDINAYIEDLQARLNGQTPEDKAKRANDYKNQLKASSIPKRYRDVTAETIQSLADATEKREALNAAMMLAKDGQTEGKTGILLAGPFGTGKTTLATYAFKSLLWHYPGTSGLWVRSSILVREVQAGYKDGTALQVLQRAAKVRVLLLDDLGDLDKTQDTADRRQIIYDILAERSDQMLPTLVTTNLTSEELALQFGERPFQRLLELCRLVRMAGKNYRKP
jgi:DNA replication protein DnaC